MSITDTQVLQKVDYLIEKIDKIDDKVDIVSHSLDEHKERHQMVLDMVMTFGKLIIGISTFLTMIGGAIFGFYKLIKGEG